MKLQDFYESNSGNLTEDEITVLSLLIHDKAHIVGQGHRDLDLDSAIKKLQKESKIQLYRGVSDKELEEIRNGSANRYLSFSEDRNIAEKFGPNVIALSPGAVGLCYWEWGMKNAEDLIAEHGEKWAEEQDMHFMVRSFKEEKEWVFPFDLKLTEVEPLVFEA